MKEKDINFENKLWKAVVNLKNGNKGDKMNKLLKLPPSRRGIEKTTRNGVSTKEENKKFENNLSRFPDFFAFKFLKSLKFLHYNLLVIFRF